MHTAGQFSPSRWAHVSILLRRILAATVTAVLAILLLPLSMTANAAQAATGASTSPIAYTWNNQNSSGIMTPSQYGHLSTAMKIQVGWDATWALLPSGELLAWGANSNLLLGWHGGSPGARQQLNGFKSDSPGTVSPHLKFKDIALQGFTGIAVDTSGKVWGMGWAGDDLLGRTRAPFGSNDNISDFVQMRGLDHITKVAISELWGTAYAVRDDGAVFAWGYNTGNVDASGKPIRSITPTRVPINDKIVNITGSGETAYAVSSSGRVWAWGENSSGQLGNGFNSNIYRPALIPNLLGVKTVAVRRDNAYALLNDGTVKSWGSWDAEALGRSVSGRDNLVPRAIPNLGSVANIAATRGRGYAILKSGAVWTWGSCTYSSGLGNCDGKPTALPSLTGITSIATGDSRNYALGTHPYSGPLPLLVLHGLSDKPASMQNIVDRARDVVPGVEIVPPKLGPTSTVDDNARLVIAAAEDLAAKTGAGRVNVIAHSKGGLDAREAMRLRPDLFNALSQIATPNGGSATATLVCTLRKFGIGLEPDKGSCQDATKLAREALDDLTTDSAKKHNKLWPDNPGAKISVSATNCAVGKSIACGVLANCSILDISDGVVCGASAFAIPTHEHLRKFYQADHIQVVQDRRCPALLAVKTLYPKALNPTNPWWLGSCKEAQPEAVHEVDSDEGSDAPAVDEEASAPLVTQSVQAASVQPGSPLRVRIEAEGQQQVIVQVLRPTATAAVSVTSTATLTADAAADDALVPVSTQSFTVSDLPSGGAELTISAEAATDVLVQTSLAGAGLSQAQVTRTSPSTVNVSVGTTGLTVPAGALTVTLAGTDQAVPMTAATNGTYTAQLAAPAGPLNSFAIRLASTTPRVITVDEQAAEQSVKVTFPTSASLDRSTGSIDRDLLLPMTVTTSDEDAAGPAHITAYVAINGTVVPLQTDVNVTAGTSELTMTVPATTLDDLGITGDLTITPQSVQVVATPQDGEPRALAEDSSYSSLPTVSVAEPTTVPQNLPPTAQATVNVTDMTASFDASGSTDPEGLALSYRWDFGDGQTSAEASPQHTYATAGIYTAKLQITDYDGAAADKALPVAIGVDKPKTVLAQDSFRRNSDSGWGTADTGGTWTLEGTPNSYRTYSSGVALMDLAAPGARSAAQLPEVSSAETTVRSTFQVGSNPQGGKVSAVMTGRQVPEAGRYFLTVAFSDNGTSTSTDPSSAVNTLDLSLVREVGTGSAAVATVLSSAKVDLATSPTTQQLQARLQVVGTNPTSLAAKVWPAGTKEPASWQVSSVDDTPALQVPGSLGIGAEAATSVTNTPTVMVFFGVSATVDEVVNKVPVAAFTATPTGLTAALDASASSDADGSVASYAWAFGDGTTAAASTTATASHTYAAAGTYPVTLTVTDDKGAAVTLSKDVVVTAPPAATTLVKDTFTRTTTSGWGSADEGGTWTPTGGAASFVTTGTQGKITVGAAGSTRSIYATSVSSTDADVSATYSLDKLSDGANYVYVYGRRLSANDDYRTSMRIGADGKVTVALSKTVGGSGTTLKTVAVPNLTYAAGQQLRVRLQVTGTGTTTLRAKVWPADTAEPTTWQVSATDTAEALQTAGSIGLGGYLSTTTTNAPGSILFEDITASTAS